MYSTVAKNLLNPLAADYTVPGVQQATGAQPQ
jgi:hypothetical protein